MEAAKNRSATAAVELLARSANMFTGTGCRPQEDGHRPEREPDRPSK